MADITYIRLEEEFVYLAVILDAYSRRVIGWHLAEGLDDSLSGALRMALAGSERVPAWSIIPIAECNMLGKQVVDASYGRDFDLRAPGVRMTRSIWKLLRSPRARIAFGWPCWSRSCRRKP